MKQASIAASMPCVADLCGYEPSTPMLLALSGGADSRLLLHLLASQAAKMGAPLRLAHVHHGIRGEAADRDEQFCRELAGQYGLALDVLHADIPAMSKQDGESLETVARRVRYAYFENVMKQNGIPILVTAHHADDNAETVLFHLIRGTGLRGLGGIAPVRPLRREGLRISGHTAVIVRPLLTYTKADVLAACQSLGLDFTEDETNTDTAYSRNHLRARVIPALSAVVEHPQAQILRSCEQLRQDEQLLCSLAEQLLNDSLTPDGALLRAALCQAHPSLAVRAVRLWLERQAGLCPTAAHLEAALSLARGGASRLLSLPGGRTVAASKQHLRLISKKKQCHTDLSPFQVDFEMGAHTYEHLGFCTDADWKKSPFADPVINVYNPFTRDTLSFDTIISCAAVDTRSLFWKSRDSGDTLLLKGMHRKLRKLQNEQGIPPHLRDRLPLLCDANGIVWAPGVGQRDGLAPHGDGDQIALFVHLHFPLTSIIEQ